MLSSHYFPFPKVSVIEVAVADFGNFQLVVPTRNQPQTRALGLALLTVPLRNYSREGWMVCRDKVVGALTQLEIGTIAPEGSPFKPIKRLGPAVPIAFETRSHRPLPALLADNASFACRLKDEAAPYCSVFRNVLPRFVRRYTLKSQHPHQIQRIVQQLLREETQFVQQNREHLQHVPFYREQFDL